MRKNRCMMDFRITSMERLILACIFILMTGFCHDTRGEKPEMFPAVETLFVEKDNELRIECYSGKATIQFSFPETTALLPRSNHEILQTENGTYTFLRSNVVSSDAGWYACAEEGVKIDNYFTNLNHTQEDISWIYVYVNDSSNQFTDTDFNHFPKTIIAIAGSTVVVPCRPTSPTAYVELWQNLKPVPIDETTARFDPKIGFIMTEVAFEAGETIIQCKIDGNHDDYIVRYSNSKPTMITSGDELILQEGEELRIECYSETTLSFLFPKILPNSSMQSTYEIFANENGLSTFLRREVVSDDTGWYGCTGEGMQNDIPYYSVNYTRNEINWIYVYVVSPVPITSGLFVFDMWSGITVIPCRPTSPGSHVQLRRKNDEVVKPSDDVSFDPKLGFILKQYPDFKDEFHCTIDEVETYFTVHYVPENYAILHAIPVMLKYPRFTVVDADDSSVHTHLITRIAGEDLRIVCEAVAPDVTLFHLGWTVPSTVSEDRVRYSWNQADGRFEKSMYLKGKKLTMTIPQIKEIDSGEYTCTAQTTDHLRKGTIIVEVFDRSEGQYIKLGRYGGATKVTGMKGRSVKWLLDLQDFSTAKITWYDWHDREINASSNSHDAKYVKTASEAGAPRMLFKINHLAMNDSGPYTISADIGVGVAVVKVDLDVQAPSTATIEELDKYSCTPGERVTATCFGNGSPVPHVAWSFLNCPKFPSRKDSTRTFLETDSSNRWLYSSTKGKVARVSFSVNMSGILTCVACNVINCSMDTKQILFSESLEPYFTSTNLNQSEVTLSLERDKDTTLVLECYVGGRPYPNVTWFKDNIPLQKNKQFNFKYNNSELSILSFLDGDGGRYMCRAENEHGKIEKYIDITIQGVPDVLRINLIVAASLLLVVIVVSWVVIGKLRIEALRKKSINLAFRNGDPNRLNPELSVVDQAELLPYDLKWEFPRELLTLDKILGSGAFGIVKKATAKSICRGEAITTVAVKLVRSKASLNFITALSRELKILVHLGKHINVVNLLGACTKNVPYGELFVIVEYCQFGNLRDYLLHGRADFVDQTRSKTEDTVASSVGSDRIDITSETLNPNDRLSIEESDQDTDSTSTSLAKDDRNFGKDSGNAHGLRSVYRGDYADMNLEPICTRDLVYWSWQVSRGMEYLGKRKVVHGDLAARNILLAANGIVKISDFGLSKALYEEAEYRKPGTDPLPIKWMAIESIKDRVFSFQSDIWSFGIVMWEFFTLAKTPYPGIKPRDLYQKLIDGHRMEQPTYATAAIYDTMLNCWKSDPVKRPSFEEIAYGFDDLLDEGFKMPYLEMNSAYVEMDAAMFENGKKDYLTMSLATLDAASTSAIHEPIEMESLPQNISGNPV